MTPSFKKIIMNKNNNPIRIAELNQLTVLRYLHRFGWLRTRDIAILVWQSRQRTPATPPTLLPTAPTPSALRMAQRTVARMSEKKLILKAKAPNGSVLYALSESGARLLRNIGMPATSGKDAIRKSSAAHFLHRCIANEIAISGLLDGYKVSTENEILRARWFGKENGWLNKKADVILRNKQILYWVEVERSRKNQKDYQALLHWLQQIFSKMYRVNDLIYLTDDLHLASIIFICTDIFKKKLIADLIRTGVPMDKINARIRFETVQYPFNKIAFF